MVDSTAFVLLDSPQQPEFQLLQSPDNTIRVMLPLPVQPFLFEAPDAVVSAVSDLVAEVRHR